MEDTPIPDLKVTVDFLIPPIREVDKGGDLRHIENDFAAVVTPGRRLAFQDRQKISLSVTRFWVKRQAVKFGYVAPGNLSCKNLGF